MDRTEGEGERKYTTSTNCGAMGGCQTQVRVCVCVGVCERAVGCMDM